jgi:hypothetical protein
MSRVRGRRSAATYAKATVIVLAVLAAGVGLFFLISPLITAIREVTGGSWGGDLAAGIGFVLLPLAIMIAYGLLARRNHWRQGWAWLLLVLYLPAFMLEPFSRSGTDSWLDQQVNTRLPGLLGGMGIGLAVLAAGVAVLFVLAKVRQRRA